MKKVLSVMLVFAMTMSLFACAKKPAAQAEAPTTAAAVVETPAAETPAPATEAPAKKMKIAVVVKVVGIDYFTVFEQGVKKFADEFGVDAFVVGASTADAAEQVNIIQDQISAGVDAICVVPNDSKVLESVLQEAQKKGIKVVATESPDQVGADYDVEMIINDMFADLIAEDAASHCEGKGEYALYVGGLTVPLHNAWADRVQKYLGEKYPEMKLCTDRIACGEDSALAREKTLELLKTYPNLKTFICFGSQGPIGAAEAITEQNLIGKITIVGNILPNEGSKYLESGAITNGYLWNPADSGYASCYIAKTLLEGGTIDKSYKIPGMGEIDLQGKTLWINNPIVITKDNWKTFGF